MTLTTATASPSDAAPPGLVWHYTDGRGLISILTNDVLWSTASSYLNDAGEVELGASLVVERLRRAALDGDPLLSALAERATDLKDREHRFASWFFILSASTSPDSLAMWRCYGGEGESYAIGLDPSRPLSILVDEVSAVEHLRVGQRGWREVAYDPARQQALVDTVLAEFLDEIPEAVALAKTGTTTPGQVTAVMRDTLAAAEEAILHIKHAGFREEQETRHATALYGIGDRASAVASVARFRHTAYGMAPYVELTGGSGAPFVGERAPLPIEAVAISPSPNGRAAVESLDALLSRHGRAGTPIIRSTIPFRA